jgi:hypothetical protein
MSNHDAFFRDFSPWIQSETPRGIDEKRSALCPGGTGRSAGAARSRGHKADWLQATSTPTYRVAPRCQFVTLDCVTELEESIEAMGEPAGMSRAGSLHFKTYLVVVLVVIFGPLGNVLAGKDVKSVGTPQQMGSRCAVLISSGGFSQTSTIWLGIGSLPAFLVACIGVLSWADDSFVQPFSAISCGVVARLSFFSLAGGGSADARVGGGDHRLGRFYRREYQRDWG